MNITPRNTDLGPQVSCSFEVTVLRSCIGTEEKKIMNEDTFHINWCKHGTGGHSKAEKPLLQALEAI